jgi:protein-disulfide isomerase
MCILSYAVCFLILYYAWIIRKRFSCEGIIQGVYQDIIYLSGFPKTSLSIGTLFIGVILLIITLLPSYWHMAPPVLPKDMPRGMTEDGHPWLGAEHPEIVIIEFTDYMCFQCKKMHFHLRRIMQNYPDKIRLVHRHFPMDEKINPIVNEPFHTGAAQLALLAIYGAEKGKFWEVNDILYQQSHTGSIVIKDLSEMTGLDYKEMQRALRERRLRIMLRKDIWEGIKKYGLSGTPGYVIDGHVYLGQIPPEILKKYIK